MARLVVPEGTLTETFLEMLFPPIVTADPRSPVVMSDALGLDHASTPDDILRYDPSDPFESAERDPLALDVISRIPDPESDAISTAPLARMDTLFTAPADPPEV